GAQRLPHNPVQTDCFGARRVWCFAGTVLSWCYSSRMGLYPTRWLAPLTVLIAAAACSSESDPTDTDVDTDGAEGVTDEEPSSATAPDEPAPTTPDGTDEPGTDTDGDNEPPAGGAGG